MSANCMVPPGTESLAPEFAAVTTEEPLASAVNFAGQFPELQHLSPKINLENQQSSVSVVLEHRQSSVSVVGGMLAGFVSISASLLFPAGAGVVTHVGTPFSMDLRIGHVQVGNTNGTWALMIRDGQSGLTSKDD